METFGWYHKYFFFKFNNCLILIILQSPLGTRLWIHYDQFSLESSSPCSYDYLITFDGHPIPLTEDTPYKNIHCGGNIPADEEFDGNTASLFFQ